MAKKATDYAIHRPSGSREWLLMYKISDEGLSFIHQFSSSGRRKVTFVPTPALPSTIRP
ncbi:hypothetical protein D3C74_123730 [compost metagenome]